MRQQHNFSIDICQDAVLLITVFVSLFLDGILSMYTVGKYLHMSSNQNPGYLLYIEIILPSYIGIIIKGSLDEKLPIYEQDPKSKRLDSPEHRILIRINICFSILILTQNQYFLLKISISKINVFCSLLRHKNQYSKSIFF